MIAADVRYAVRRLVGSPWYSTTVIGVIALTMTLGVTAFAVVDGVLFKPLPYPKAGEIYVVSGGYQRGQQSGIVIAPRNARDWAEAIPGAKFALWNGGGGGARFGDVRGWLPSPAGIDQHFFDVLGIQPLIGGFQPGDFEADAGTRPAIISYGLWQSMFAGRPDVVGQLLSVPNGRGYRVAGVLPRDFVFPITSKVQPNILSPIVIPADRRGDLRYRCCTAIARIPGGGSVAQFQERLDAAARAESVDWVPQPNDGSPVFDRVGVEPIEMALTSRQRPMFATIVGTVAVLLVLGCVNISGLMSSRIQDKSSELAVRRALGADFASLARLVLAESLVLAGAGTALGVMLAPPLLNVIVNLTPDRLGLLKQPTVDVRVLVATALATLVVTIAIAIVPIARAARVATSLVRTPNQATARRPVGRFALVTAQVALGFTLTIGGTLVVGSLARVHANDLGFSPDRLLILEGAAKGASVADRIQTIDRISTQLRQLPGVTAVGSTQSGLIRRSLMMNVFRDGATYAVTPGFFEAVELTLVEGRLPSVFELESGAPVAVVSERVGRRAFPQQRAIGQTLQSPKGPFAVVGVVKDARLSSWDAEGLGQIYAPYTLVAQNQAQVSLVLRLAGRADMGGVMSTIARRPDVLAGDLQVTTVATAPDLLADSIRERRLQAWIFGGFGAAALLIVGVGVLGLMAMSTARRTREIGIRVALGATQRKVVQLLVGEQLTAACCGLLVGALVSSWAVTFVRAYLYQVTAYDAWLWSAAIALVVGTTILGAVVPSWRSSRTDPITALRVE